MGGAKGGKGGGKEDDEESRQRGKGRTRARAKAAESEEKGFSKVEEVKPEKGADKGKGKGKAKGDFRKGADYGGKDGKYGKDGDKGKGKGKDGDKGKGKSKDGDKGKGKGKGKDKGKDEDDDWEGDASKGIMMQDLEAKIATQAKPKAGSSSKTNPFEAKGVYCDVKKHSDMGCAVVMMESEAASDAVLEYGKKNLSSKGRPQVKIGDLMVDMRRHPAEEGEARNGIFVAWGRKVEKTTPLPASSIAEAFDDLWRDIRGTTNIAGVSAPAVMPSSTPVPVGVPAVPKATQPPTPAALTPEQQLFYAQLAMVGQAAMQAQAQLATAPAGVAASNGPTATAATATAAGRGLPATSGGMRHDAPTFTPIASQQQQQLQQQMLLQQQHQQLQQLQVQMQQMQQMQQMHEMTQMWYQNTPDNGDASATTGSYFGQPTPAAQERRPLEIKDPKSGATIEAPVLTALDSFEPQAPTRKAMAIVDPSSGKAVDAMQVLGFQPAEPKNPMTITDPKSGDIIKI